MYDKLLLFSCCVALLFGSCQPQRDDDFQLPAAAGAPDFSVEFLAGDPNRVVIKDLSSGNFQRIWDLLGGTPKNSTWDIDTILYAKKGVYNITLYVSKDDGSGTPSASKSVTILDDADLSCTPALAALTGDCGPDGKCWTFTQEAGAVKVGPNYADYSWYTSPAGALQVDQYDDAFCFKIDGAVYENRNNGLSVNPWNGYAAEPLDPGVSDFVYSAGTGTGGLDQIILADDQFIGVRDADNVLDVVTLTANVMVVRARICDVNGVPTAGWFELKFVLK
jgi:PKD repeat protein